MLKMHHIGVAVNDIETTSNHYINDIGGFTKSEIFLDENQGINIQWLYPKDKSGLPIELIQPVTEKNPVANILKKSGVTPYHICYETDDIKAEYNRFRDSGYICIGSFFIGVAHEGRTCVFLYHKDMVLLELVESK